MPYEEKAPILTPKHDVSMESRKKLTVSGIVDVESFNEDEIVLRGADFVLCVRGSGFRMEKLNVDTGDAVIKGRVDLLEYEDGPIEKTGLFSRFFS